MDKTLLDSVIRSVEDTGFKVTFMTCDQGPDNLGLYTDLKITSERPWYDNPARKSKIWAGHDVPHLLKSLR